MTGLPLLSQLGALLQALSWVPEHAASIKAYFDPPKSLEELRSDVQKPARGYYIHHLVEPTPAGQEGYPRSLVDARENLVRISRLKHWEIAAWFQGVGPPQ